jgi:CRISPR/Cas system CSM-associated protein Csm3 (group 7 of RAMP superfamily)
MSATANTFPKARWPIRHVARVVIQFTTPFHVGSGDGDEDVDAVVVRDANGLPSLPGSSLAGVLRSAVRERVSQDMEKEIFGYQEANQGCGSRLSVSWGCIHDENNLPVEDVVSPAALADDNVLADAATLHRRDHVCITHRGVADTTNRGKFDEQSVSAGHRFTFELELLDDSKDSVLWATLVTLLNEGWLRIGGKTRRGYGAFKLISLRARSFDLRDEIAFAAYTQQLPVSLAGVIPAGVLPELTKPGMTAPSKSAVVRSPERLTITLQLVPRGYWMFVGGLDPEDQADATPLRENFIAWREDNGKACGDVEQGLRLPASSIKGALSHRVAFHFNRRNSKFADEAKTPADLEKLAGEANEAVKELFGFRKNDDTGQAGRMFLDDLFLANSATQSSASQTIHHVSIDRFTGGARDQMLFSERPLWKGTWPTLTLTVLEPNQLTNGSRIALHAAVLDLAEGRLPVGAGAGRGLGFFDKCASKAVWDFNGNAVLEDWLKKDKPAQP